MDGFHGATFSEPGVEGPFFSLISKPQTEDATTAPAPAASLTLQRLDDLDTVILTKTITGFDAPTIAELRERIRDAAAGRLGRLKFLVVDFAHNGYAGPANSDEFDALITEAANLILSAPIVLIANARGPMAGADIEFALACSMLVGEAGSEFSFAEDPIVSVETYGFLAQKLGFVRAERLMESGEILTAQQMHELLLLKDVIDDGEGLRGFLAKTARRHNSCYGIYRASRMASPVRRGRVA
jgi:enoyl-CoA hydratase/carnithine racemase